MALTPRNNKRKPKKKQPDAIKQIAEGTFFGLDFITKLSDITDKEEVVTTNPNIHFKGNSILMDYGHVLSGTRNKSNREEIKLFFQHTVSKNDTITITNGEYLNELSGDSSAYDIGGTYTFIEFDPNTFIVVLEKSSINNQSPTYDTYNKNYFFNGSLRWTTSSSTDEDEVETMNEIINRLGYHSTNSFFSIFGFLKKLDIIELMIDKDTNLSFTVKNYYKDDENIEHVEVEETVPTDKDMFGVEVFGILKRKPEKISNEGTKPSVIPPNRSQRGRGTEDGRDSDKCKECYNDGSGFPYDNREQKACEERCEEQYLQHLPDTGHHMFSKQPSTIEDIQAADRYAGCLKKCGCQSCNWKPGCHIACWGRKAAKKFKCECRYIWGCASMMSDGCNPVHVPEDECNANPYYEWVPATDDHPGYCQWLEIVDL